MHYVFLKISNDIYVDINVLLITSQLLSHTQEAKAERA
jgi:hypothetical protein